MPKGIRQLRENLSAGNFGEAKELMRQGGHEFGPKEHQALTNGLFKAFEDLTSIRPRNVNIWGFENGLEIARQTGLSIDEVFAEKWHKMVAKVLGKEISRRPPGRLARLKPKIDHYMTGHGRDLVEKIRMFGKKLGMDVNMLRLAQESGIIDEMVKDFVKRDVADGTTKLWYLREVMGLANEDLASFLCDSLGAVSEKGDVERAYRLGKAARERGITYSEEDAPRGAEQIAKGVLKSIERGKLLEAYDLLNLADMLNFPAKEAFKELFEDRLEDLRQIVEKTEIDGLQVESTPDGSRVTNTGKDARGGGLLEKYLDTIASLKKLTEERESFTFTEALEENMRNSNRQEIDLTDLTAVSPLINSKELNLKLSPEEVKQIHHELMSLLGQE